MQGPKRTWWARFLCWIGWHRELGITVGNFIRCYGCGKDYDGAWIDHKTFLERHGDD